MLDLFSISKGLRAGQDAYSRGQKEQADRYWSEIENSLKVMASAQGIRESAELSPYKVRSEQMQAFQRQKAGEYSEQRALTTQGQRPYDIEHEKNLAESAGKLTDVRELDRQQKERDLEAEIANYDEWKATTTNPNKTPAGFMYETKIKPKLEEQQFKTREAGAQADIAETKVQTAVDESKVLAGMGTSAGKVSAEEMISKAGKTKSDAEIAGIKLKYADRQAKATLDATLARAEKSAETGGYKVSQWADDVGVVDGRIDTLYNRNVLIDRTLAYLSKSSSMDEFINAVAAQTDTNLTGVAGQVADATSLESAKQSLLDAKKINLDRIVYLQQRKNQLNRLAGMPDEPIIQVKPPPAEPAKEQTITVEQTGNFPYEKFNKLPKDQQQALLKENALRGIRKIELSDKDDYVVSEINIKQQPNGDYYFSGAMSWTLKKNQTTQPNSQIRSDDVDLFR